MASQRRFDATAGPSATAVDVVTLFMALLSLPSNQSASLETQLIPMTPEDLRRTLRHRRGAAGSASDIVELLGGQLGRRLFDLLLLRFLGLIVWHG